MVLKIHVVRQGGHRLLRRRPGPRPGRGSLVAGEEPGVWTGAGASPSGWPERSSRPRFRRGARRARPLVGPGPAPARGGSEHRRLRPHLLRPEVGEPAPPARAPGDGRGRGPATMWRWPTPSSTWDGRLSGSGAAGRGEVAFLASTGPVAGAFVHRTSRALDPHLHTHLVVANVAQGVDGVWSGARQPAAPRPPRRGPVASTTPASGSSSAGAWGRHGRSDRPGWVT